MCVGLVKVVKAVPWGWIKGARVSWAEARRRKRHNRREWRRRLLHVRHLCNAYEGRILAAAEAGDRRIVMGLLLVYLSEATEGDDLKNVIDAGSIDFVDPSSVQAYVSNLEPIPRAYFLGMRTLNRAGFSEYEDEQTAIRANHRISAKRYAVARFCWFIGTKGDEIYDPS